jgi:glycosyltransferase involved in cell wall biosynthesis
MRILQVIHDFVPETLAGAEINTHKLSVDLAANGHEVFVFCRGWNLQVPPYSIRDEVLDGLHVRRVDFGTDDKPHQSARHNPKIDQAFRDYLEIAKPDLIHFQHLIYLTTELPGIAKATGVPIMVSLRDFWFECPVATLLYHDNTICNKPVGLECVSCLWPDTLSRKRKVYPWPIINPVMINGYQAGLKGILPKSSIQRRILDSLATWKTEFLDALLCADVVHSPSQFLADRVIDFGVPRERVVVIENGIRYDPNSIAPKTPGTKLRLGQIGVSKHKGTQVAVEAMRYLPHDAAELKVFGKINDKQKAEFSALAPGANVQFMGQFQQSQIFDLFSEMDVLIVPSIWYENCPTVIREAFATQTPVITSGVGGMAEAVRDGVDGLHFKVNDPKDLAAKLQKLIDNPGLVKEYSANIIPPPIADKVSAEIEAIYHQLMAGKQARSA